MQTRFSLLQARWLFLLCFVGLLLAVALSPTDTAAVSAFRRGEGLMQAAACGQDRAGPESEVEAAYRRVIAHRPLDPQPWQRLAQLYTAWERPDEAFEAFSQSQRRISYQVAPNPGLAQVYSLVGDYRQSASYWTEYLVHRPDDRAARLALARTAVLLFDWQRARSELEGLLRQDPDTPLFHAWLGLLLVEPEPAVGLSHLQRAADDPALATWLEPVLAAQRLSTAADDPAYRAGLLGRALLQLDAAELERYTVLHLAQPGGLAMCPEKTVEAGAGNSPQPAARAVLTRAISALAARSLLAAVSRNSVYAEAYAYLGQAFDRLGWPDQAWKSLEGALQFAPRSSLVLTLAGLYWDRHGEPELARHYYEQAYGQDRESSALCVEIAGTYATEGRYTAAEAWLLLATEIAPGDPAIWTALAHFYLDPGIGTGESGLPAAARLLELVPEDAAAHDMVGWAHFLLGENIEAEASLTQALTLDPTLASAHYHLGRLRVRQGQYAEAAKAYRLAEAYDQDDQLATALSRAWSELQRDGQARP